MASRKTLTRPKRVEHFAIPPYLWRTAAPNSQHSRGHNTPDIIDPLCGHRRSYHASMMAIEYCARKYMILDHLKWKYEVHSEFSSWSDSLLWVLVHAARKHHYLRERGVLIYVMDTRRLSASRIHRASQLIRNHGLEHQPGVRENAEQGEYLIHGKLENESGLWRAVRFTDLVDAGFWELGCFNFETFVSKKGLLLDRVLALRAGWFQRMYTLEDRTYYALGRLAECFGPDWQGVVMVALIALRNRCLSPPELTRMTQTLRYMKIPQLPWSESEGLRGYHMLVYREREVCQFLQLLRMLNDESAALQEEEASEQSSHDVSECRRFVQEGV